VSNKMTCPGCNSHTSDVLRAFEDGAACPYCGLSAEATLEIQAVRKSRADEAIKVKCEQALKERDEAQRELRWAKQRLERLTGKLKEAARQLEQPLQEEEGARRW
jgi:DNA repair exonuclease SbcCD ATPase subunit